ncbi:hypothetical protein LV82_00988 [Albidovulum inexpectatum]|uniref:DUF4156 domain-containing protein n=1 Tax=Albidovulum inexpectatum TaxID=196587 RepID=A0A2S5JK49_9RHOB|nr:hypothetical protein [Albidovulum inexpectatum]PPB81771.1 hypothetical protein LV82_00988 [Albidovulum inexpectatum]
MKIKYLFWGGFVAASACTPDPGLVGVAGMREARADEVAQCTYVSDFRMVPQAYGLFSGPGLKYARNKIMADAQAAGANTVVFDPVSPGQDVYVVHAVAYRC